MAIGADQAAGHFFPHQLPAAIKLARAFPEQAFILDHIGKPAIKSGVMNPWADLISELAALPNVSCKVSGMITEADWINWKPADFKPFLDVVFAAFGPDRVIYGSDWPVCLLAGGYGRVYELARDYAHQFGENAGAKFLGENATAFYGLK